MMLLALLVVMHVNFVAQPGCAKEFSGGDIADAQLVQIKIVGSWSRDTTDTLASGLRVDEGTGYSFDAGLENLEQSNDQIPDMGSGKWHKGAKFWLSLIGSSALRSQTFKRNDMKQKKLDTDGSVGNNFKAAGQQSGLKVKFASEVNSRPIAVPGRGSLHTALLHYMTRWGSYFDACLKRAEQTMRSFWQVWRITGWEPFTASPKGDRRNVAWSKMDSALVDLPDKRRKVLDPTYLYSVEKGYLMLSEGARIRHKIKTVNISISAHNTCFGNRWQQLLIDNFVGYDTILTNSLLNARGQGYFYNFQTKELYNLNYLQEFSGLPHGFEDYIVFKCGVLITSLFVFFTTTMSVSFTLRETQSRMLKFTVQLQHHARHRLPTFRLIFVHVIESLVFVPIMIGILFFLFEFFDDQLLAFMVLTLVWLCELFTMISVRTPLSMQYFPRFFFLYFMAFHIYFFSYTYGFSYVAFSATGAFMQHLVLYFWNRFEVPALQSFLRRRALLQQHGLHITSSAAILTSAVQVARVNNALPIELRENSANGNLQRIPGNETWPLLIHSNDRQRLDHLTSLPDRAGMRSERVTRVLPDGQLILSGGDGSSVSILSATASGFPDGNTMLDSSGEIMNNHARQSGNPESDQSMGYSIGSRLGQLGSINEDRSRYPDAEAGVPEPAGQVSTVGSMLPWMLGGPSGGLVSFLPIFREFTDQHPEYNSAVGTTQEVEEQILQGALQRGLTDAGLRRRPQT